MRITYFGSGVFGAPTFGALRERHEIALVVSQPDRRAGRGRVDTPTPISGLAVEAGLELIRPEDPADPGVIEHIRSVDADAFVVVAYGHKLTPALLADRFAINLHASLLPKYRGAAPINWAMINGDRETGVSVIGLAQRMDAGLIHATAATPIDPLETAGELHDRLAILGVDPVLQTLDAHAAGTLSGQSQDDAAATRAPKLSRADATIDFSEPARVVRQRVHGLTPWPGCSVTVGPTRLRLHRVRDVAVRGDLRPAQLSPEGRIGCGDGALELLEIQPAGRKIMSFDAWQRGNPIETTVQCAPA